MIFYGLTAGRFEDWTASGSRLVPLTESFKFWMKLMYSVYALNWIVRLVRLFQALELDQHQTYR